MTNFDRKTIMLSPLHNSMMIALIFFLLSSTMVWGQQSRANQEHASIVKSGLASSVHPHAKVKKGNKNALVLKIFPNPATQEIDISLPKIISQAEEGMVGFELEVHNMQGRQVLSQKWNGEKIDVSQFQSGIYIVTLRKGHQYYSQKLVVKRE